MAILGSTGGNLTVNGTALYSAKAWVTFNGTGTIAIRDSFNVSSITDLGTGVYDINYTTSMTDINYAYASGTGYVSTASIPYTNKFYMKNYNTAGGLQDPTYASFIVIR